MRKDLLIKKKLKRWKYQLQEIQREIQSIKAVEAELHKAIVDNQQALDSLNMVIQIR